MNLKINTCILLFFGIFMHPFSGIAQSSFRTIDGTYNNIGYPALGATFSPLAQFTTVGFQDGASAPSMPNGPNPRTVSNTIFSQNSLVNDPLALSDFTWVFGQFLDHDVTLIENNSTEPLFINVPSGDQWFDPFFQGTAIIPLFRSEKMSNTGTSGSNPRLYPNHITHWIDGSNIYGSDSERGYWLRTLSEGKLKTSNGDMLPFNTVDGESGSPIDSNAPGMANDVGIETHLYVAGDVRANENILLLAMHTLFIREHNRICDEINAETPGLSDELVYQTARKKVGAILQAIVYEEWLPAMGIHIPSYNGYDNNVDASVTNVFSAAAFRMGHTLLNSNVMRLGNNGETIPEGNVTLQEAFFRPSLLEEGGVDPLFKGMAAQIEQDLDGKMVNDVRNFLFGPPGAGGLDLAAINIQRGRERGLSDFNTIREDYFLSPFTSFDDINSDPNVSYALQSLYGTTDQIDPWVGMLVEEHMPGALVGETIMEILIHQFAALRDGDRFYYEGDTFFTNQEIEEIKNTTLGAVIKRNTSILLMQENVFEAMPHSQICPAPAPYADINVHVQTEAGINVEDVEVVVSDFPSEYSEENGIATFDNLETCVVYEVLPSKNTNHVNGVTALDLALIQRHILNSVPLDSPYKLIAADANRSGTISTIDLVEMQQLILGIKQEYTNNNSWRFIESNHVFASPTNPFADAIQNPMQVEFLENNVTLDFIGIKIGDVNDSVNPTNLTDGTATRNARSIHFEAADQVFEKGEEITLEVTAADIKDVMAYQFSLNYDVAALEISAIIPGDIDGLTENSFANFQERGIVTSAWYNETAIENDAVIFKIKFIANTSGTLSELVSISSDITIAEGYNNKYEKLEVTLEFAPIGTNTIAADAITLYQNTPNPVNGITTIGFVIPEDGKATLSVFDVNGKLVKSINDNFSAGYNEVVFNKAEFNATGILYYKLSSEFGTATKKMVITE